MSSKYLLRARANLSVNGFGGSLHRFSEADCTQWLQSCRERYGVIFIDPPALARHQKLFFDLQKDHVRLLQLAMERLTRDGILVLASNFRKFNLDPLLLEEFQVEEITEQVAAEDYTRNSRIHRCWVFRHRADEEQSSV
jgi:23S rRNA (guanine2445-N2)-methyltransferase / 23S rRNA (guanine2069-N7)-methyltransferase